MTDCSKLKVGDKVVVTSGWNNEYKTLTTITKVLKTYFVLEDESKWNFSGHRKGERYPQGFCEPITPEVMAEVDRLKFCRAVKHWAETVNQQPLTVVAEVWGLMRQHRIEKKEKTQ